MSFKYITNTSIIIDNKKHLVRLQDGMTGIGSRKYWINDKEQHRNIVTQSEDLTKGNHEIYTIKWRDTSYDKIDIIIHEDEVAFLLNEENAWREPKKLNINVNRI